jgi:hypothetical protein
MKLLEWFTAADGKALHVAGYMANLIEHIGYAY